MTTENQTPEQETQSPQQYVNALIGSMPAIEMSVPVYVPGEPHAEAKWEKMTVAITSPIEVDAYIHAVIKNTHEQFMVEQNKCLARAAAAQATQDWQGLMSARCDEAALIGHHSALTATFENTVRAVLQKMLARDTVNEDRVVKAFNTAWYQSADQHLVAGYQNGWFDKSMTQTIPSIVQ